MSLSTKPDPGVSTKHFGDFKCRGSTRRDGGDDQLFCNNSPSRKRASQQHAHSVVLSWDGLLLDRVLTELDAGNAEFPDIHSFYGLGCGSLASGDVWRLWILGDGFDDASIAATFRSDGVVSPYMELLPFLADGDQHARDVL